MGQLHRFLGVSVGRVGPDLSGLRATSARPTRATSPTGPTPSSASTTCATTWRGAASDMVQRGHHYAIVDEVDSILIDEARTPLIISGPAADVDQALLPVRLDRAHADARRRLRGRRGEADRRAHRGGHREGRAAARRGQPLRRRGDQLRPPARPGPAAKELYHRDKDYLVDARRGEDRRRVHRPHPRRAPLVRRHCTRPSRPRSACGSRRRTTPGRP